MVKIISFWKDIHSVKLGWSCCLFWLQRDNIVTMLQQVANLDFLTVLSDDNVTDCWNHKPKYQESVSPHDILKSSIKTKAGNLGKRSIKRKCDILGKRRREEGTTMQQPKRENCIFWWGPGIDNRERKKTELLS